MRGIEKAEYQTINSKMPHCGMHVALILIGRPKEVKIMEWLTYLLLGLGLVFLMSRGRGGMGCCGGGHGNNHSGSSERMRPGEKESAEAKRNVIDLRKDEYRVITATDGRPSLNRGEASAE